MINFADVKLSARHTRSLHLRVASEAEVRVGLGQHFEVY